MVVILFVYIIYSDIQIIWNKSEIGLNELVIARQQRAMDTFTRVGYEILGLVKTYDR